MDFTNIPIAVQNLANIATALGIIVAIILYFKDRNKDRNDNFFQTYDTIDDKYIDFLKICIENPELGCHLQSIDKDNLTEDQKIQRLAVFETLISIFERAFLLYKRQPKKIKIHQWEGWAEYIETWFCKPSFRYTWEVEGATWDFEFVEFMNTIYNKTAPKIEPPV